MKKATRSHISEIIDAAQEYDHSIKAFWGEKHILTEANIGAEDENQGNLLSDADVLQDAAGARAADPAGLDFQLWR